MSTAIEKRIEYELSELTSQSLYRTVPEFRPNCGMVDCSTNSYLGLDTNTTIEEMANSMISTSAGNLASRLIRSGSPLFSELERELAQWKGTESALLFNSGYTANTGIIQALARRSTVVFSDRLNHASIVDGIILSGARLVRYEHNNIYDLESKISNYPDAEKIIITDSLFSMDGDIADLVRIARIADDSGSLFMVDEAHSSGIYGHSGSGLVKELQLSENVDITVGTLSKALSGVGGYYAGSSLIRNYLINKSRPLIYSTALPESCLARNLAAVRYIRHHPRLGMELLEMAHTFREALSAMGYNIGNSVSYIIPVITGSAEKAVALSDYLLKQNIVAPAIRTPTVPVGQSRVRLSLHRGITQDEMAHLIKTFEGAALWVNADS